VISPYRAKSKPPLEVVVMTLKSLEGETDKYREYDLVININKTNNRG